MKPSDVDSIVIHCSATREGQNVKASDIDKQHKDRGFKCIGYHFVIDLDGSIEVGRPLTMSGAHCNTSGLSGRPYNSHSIGICYIGGLDKKGNPKDTRTNKQKKALHNLVYSLLMQFPIKEIIGHRDASPDKNNDGQITPNEWIKSCPCFDVKAEFPVALIESKRK